MSIDMSQLQAGLDGLAVTRDEAFARVVVARRMKFNAADGSPDLVDDWSARLVCSALMAQGALLLVLPDAAPRRAPLLFASSVVFHSAARLREQQAGGRILYVSASSTVREQLSGVSVGAKSLADMYVQEYGRGDAIALKSTGPGSTLPRVLCVASPADPLALLRRYRPTWIAVDAEDAVELRWLKELLSAARSARVPIVAWTHRAFSGCVTAWREQGAAVFRWPQMARGVRRVERANQLNCNRVCVQLEPAILEGADAAQLSTCFASAAHHLAVAHRNVNGRLSRDAVLVGWRYLRSMESLAAPLSVYEAEAPSLWGVPCLARLRSDFRQFIDAVRGTERVQEPLHSASRDLEAAHEDLTSLVDPPMWTAAARACALNGSPRRVVFGTRSMRDIFRFALASRFRGANDSPLHAAELTHLGAEDERLLTDESSPDLVLVGLPSRHNESRIERLLASGRLQILLWPHQADVLRWRIEQWNRWFEGSCEGDTPLSIEKADSAIDSADSVRLGPKSSVLIESKPSTFTSKPLWTAPDTAAAIRDLFDVSGINDPQSDSDADSAAHDNGGGQADASEFLDHALRISFDDGRSCMVPSDDRVNLVMRGATGMEVQRRNVAEVVPGSIVLLVNGEHRHGLYGLLLGRVHRHPAIVQFVTLVARWHEDLATAYRDAARRGLTPERLLEQLQARGSQISCALTVRNWLDQVVRSPNDVDDLRRLAEVLSMPFVAKYYRQIHTAARKLWGLHISLSARLNRWLETETAGRASLSAGEDIIDEQLGLTIEDFRHSLAPLRVRDVRREQGLFLRSQLGRLEGSAT